MVTASDASESGGGVCFSTGLTSQGRQRLAEMERERRHKDRGRVGLMESFRGISGGRRAFEVLGVKPCLHMASEIDEAAIRVSQSAYPQCRHLRDIKEITVDMLAKEGESHMHLTDIFHFAGSPCQGFQVLTPQEKVWKIHVQRLCWKCHP